MLHQKPNVRGHLQVRALFRALEHGVQRLDAVVEYAVAAGNRSRRLQFKLLRAPHLKRTMMALIASGARVSAEAEYREVAGLQNKDSGRGVGVEQ